MVGQPYMVAGKTYVPHGGRGYDREGWASWYGTAFHGRLTANGEIFDRDSIAAAHPTLPLPSYVRITNVVTHRSMIVRVNDRGPYEQGRLIDVSERAAEALGFRRRGTSRVRVEYVGRASLKGSDDEKLLATLTSDGTPAHLGSGRSPTMLARLDHGEAATSEPTAAKRVAPAAPYRVASADPAGEQVDEAPSASTIAPPAAASSSGSFRPLPEYPETTRPPLASRGSAPVPPPRAKEPARLASTESATRPPLDIRPPARPELGAIY